MRAAWAFRLSLTPTSRIRLAIRSPGGKLEGSRSSAHLQLRDPAPRQLVGALVLGMAGMAAHPEPLDLVLAAGGVEPLPQVGVLHRLLVGRAPAAPLPVVDPLGDALLHVLA